MGGVHVCRSVRLLRALEGQQSCFPERNRDVLKLRRLRGLTYGQKFVELQGGAGVE